MIGSTIAAENGKVGDAVRVTSWGGDIRLHDVGRFGRIVRFTKSGNVVLAFGDIVGYHERIDRDGCSELVGPTGKLIREESERVGAARKALVAAEAELAAALTEAK